MIQKKILLVFVVSLLLLASCAIRGGGPVGGEQDMTPPKVTTEKPANRTTNFNADKIVISFDEYIELSNQAREITFTPALPQVPEIYLARKSVYINLRKSVLQPNTTYVIQFGQSIRDINEGNILRDYRYVFSTGSFIDSLYLGGNVISSATGKAAENVRISLYPADINDSAIYKTRASYFTSADAQGNFRIDNLPKGRYKLYALTDANQNYLLDGDEQVGFYGSDVNIDSSISLNDPILLFPSKLGTLRLRTAYIDNRKNAFTFTQTIDSLSINQQFVPLNSIQTFINERKDSFILYNLNVPRFTGNKISIHARSGALILDTTLQITAGVDTGKLSFEFLNAIHSANNLGSPLALQANYPIKTIVPANISLLEDNKPVIFKEMNFTDSSRTTIALVYPFDEEKAYSVKMKQGALVSYFNQSSDSVTHKIDLPQRRNFGLLNTRILLPKDSFYYIAQITSTSGTINYSRAVKDDERISIPYIAPGTYRLRLIKDDNRNGRWDTGNVLQKKLPEEIIYHTEDLNIKANWELVDVVFDFSK